MQITNILFESPPHYKSQLYQREIQLLINILQPDPEYQPEHITDEVVIFNFVTATQTTIRRRLSDYFEQPFTCNLNQPLWQLVEEIRIQQPDWPN